MEFEISTDFIQINNIGDIYINRSICIEGERLLKNGFMFDAETLAWSDYDPLDNTYDTIPIKGEKLSKKILSLLFKKQK